MELTSVAREAGEPAKLRLALLAQDAKKQELLALLLEFLLLLTRSDLMATGGTGALAARWLGLPITLLKSGLLGGYQQVGARVVEGGLDAVILLRDPLTDPRHDAETAALLRVCDVYQVAVATNSGTARLVLAQLEAGGLPASRAVAPALTFRGFRVAAGSPATCAGLRARGELPAVPPDG